MDLLIKSFSILPADFRFKIFLIFLSSVLVVILELIGIALILPLTAILVDPSKLKLIEKYFVGFDVQSLIDQDKLLMYGIIFFIFIFILKIISLIFLNIYKANFFYKIKIKMTELLYAKYLNEDYLFHVNVNSSTLITNIHGEIGLYVKKILNVFCELLLDILLFISLLLILLKIRPVETVIALLVFGFLALLYFIIIKKKLDFWGKQRQKQDRKKLKHLQQSLIGIKEVKIYLKEFFFENILNNINSKREDVTRKLAYVSPIPRYILELATVIFVLIFCYFMTSSSENFEEFLPQFALYFGSFLRMLPIFTKLINNFQTLKFGKPTVHTLYKDFSVNNNLSKFVKYSEPLIFNKGITFRNVSFKYPSKKDFALKNLNLNFGQGKIIGILGNTGSGKTTFLNLLTGLIEPTSGEILCDDKRINFNNPNWKKKLSYVTQKTFLIDDSIKNNILFGESENYDINKFNEALKFSYLQKFIDKLPDGVNTLVGESGVKLSGGQVQRISIARALYNSPEILVFDEPTNSLDEETEEKIISEIFELKGKSTIFLVTHNKKLTLNCDETYLVEDNKFSKL